jgi:hypothetical protein
VSINLKPFPSSRFFLTLFAGSSGYLLASAPGIPGIFQPQAYKKSEIIIN